MKHCLGLRTTEACFKLQSAIKHRTRIRNIVNVKDLNLSGVYRGNIGTFTTLPARQYIDY